MSYQSTHNMPRPAPCAADLVINSGWDSGLLPFPLLLPAEKGQDYMGMGYSKLVVHFFCSQIHALPTKPLVNLQTRQTLPFYLLFWILSCTLSLIPQKVSALIPFANGLPSSLSSIFHTLPLPFPTFSPKYILALFNTNRILLEACTLQIKLTDTMVWRMQIFLCRKQPPDLKW